MAALDLIPPPPYRLPRSHWTLGLTRRIAAAFLGMVGMLLILPLLLWLGLPPYGPRLLLDTAFAFGLGTEAADRRVTIVCGDLGADKPFLELSGGSCVVRAGYRTADGASHAVTAYLDTAYELRPEQVRSVRYLAAWPSAVAVDFGAEPLLDRWGELFPFFVMAAIGAGLVWTASVATRGHRRWRGLEKHGRVTPVDLLKREYFRVGDGGFYRWHFAWEGGGRRRYAHEDVREDPLTLDWAVTRGAALVGPRNKPLLLRVKLAPIELDQGKADRIQKKIGEERWADGQRRRATAPPDGDWSAYHRQDWAAALAEFTRRAEAGDPAGACGLAMLHDGGLGVERDLDVAARWYRFSAERGYPFGQHGLADMLFNGAAVEKDLPAAFVWAQLAAERYGDPEKATKAIELRHAASFGMTLDEIEALFAKVRAWRPGRPVP